MAALMQMQHGTQAHGLWLSLKQIFSHSLMTLLAVAVAFSLPQGASYILNQWWPRVEGDANLLLTTEIGLASILALLFNFAKIAWDSRQKVRVARLAALVYARNGGRGWLTRWRERALVKQLPAARDACILTLTGFDTFVSNDSLLRGTLEKAYEVRVMLLSPVGAHMRRRADSLPPDVTVLTLQTEIEASIAYLSGLRRLGKKVTLKFYEDEPFWKVIVLGDHVWVQHCHSGFQVSQQPEYVFALQHREPRNGLFVPFYTYFLNEWNDFSHPEYDFDTNELVYRDAARKETRRVVLGAPIDGSPASAVVARTETSAEIAALLRRPAVESADTARTD